MYSKTAIQSLQVLRPETVLALENVSFILRARALPDVEEASNHLGEVLLTGDNPDEDTLDPVHLMRLTPDIEQRMVVTDRHVIAGGLIYDRDAENPFEPGSSNGNIYHASTRRGDAEERRKYYVALGMNEDGSKDFSSQSVRDRLVKHVMKGIGNDLALLTRLLHRLRATGRTVSKASLQEVIQFAIDQEGWEYAPDYVADALYGVPYWNRIEGKLLADLEPLADLISESVAEQCWDEAQEAGEVGNPLAVPLDIYEHGGVSYSLAGTGMNCRWDTSHAAAVWVPDEDAISNIRASVMSELGIGEHPAGSTSVDAKILSAKMYDKAREYCKGILEKYNDWANGSVYGVVVYVIDRQTGRRIKAHDDECWGFIGSTYAESELEEAILAKVVELGQPLH